MGSAAVKLCSSQVVSTGQQTSTQKQRAKRQLSDAAINSTTSTLAKSRDTRSQLSVVQSPVLTHVIQSVYNSAVWGVTSLNDLLFVARYRDIEVYDTATFTLQRHIGLSGSIDGLTSCGKNNCLYVSDYCGAVHKVELSADNKTMQWRVDDGPYGLSVNNVSNVIVTCVSSNKILEYTTSGSLVRQISLQPDVEYPRHAIQLTNGQFVVCHGVYDSLNRVCVVDSGGNVVVSYGNKCGSATGQLNEPMHLAVDKNGFIFVADHGNNRIVVLNPSLIWSRDLSVSVDGGLQGPRALYLDESRGRLYVGEVSGNKRVVILNNVM